MEDENLAGEPNVEIASTWWPDMENTWVPIGWKDHPLRFNVLYNGTVIAQPVRCPARGQGVQLTFQLSRDGAVPIGNSTKPFQLRHKMVAWGTKVGATRPPPYSGHDGGRTTSFCVRRSLHTYRAAVL